MPITATQYIRTSDKILRQAIFKAHDGKCFYTGREMDFNSFHIDHIDPRSKGGGDYVENYVPCCQDINLRKNGRRLPLLISVSLEANKALFVQNVIDLYADIELSDQISKEYIWITAYIRKHGIKKAVSFRQYARYQFTGLRITKPNQKKPKIFYKISELDSIVKYRD